MSNNCINCACLICDAWLHIAVRNEALKCKPSMLSIFNNRSMSYLSNLTTQNSPSNGERPEDLHLQGCQAKPSTQASHIPGSSHRFSTQLGVESL